MGKAKAMKEGINIPVTVDAKDLPYEMDKAVSVVERATKGMSKSLGDAVKQSGFHYKSLQEAYSTTVRHAELLAVTLGEDSKAYKDAVMQAQNYATKMQGVQSAIHNSTSTIGKGTGQLNMAMAQLTREAPSFTHSMTTGFMAVSNNIPILVDEINRLKIANQGLAASGQATKSVFSSVVGALFSWQTALSLGITVLTVFGAKIAENISYALEDSDAIKELDKSIANLTVTMATNAQIFSLWNSTYGQTLTGKEKERFEAREAKEKRFQEIAKLSMQIQRDESETGKKNLIGRNMIYLALQENVEAYYKALEKINKVEATNTKVKPIKVPLEIGSVKWSMSEGITDLTPLIGELSGAYDELSNSIGMASIKHEMFMAQLPQMVDLSKQAVVAVNNMITETLTNTASALGDALASGQNVGEQILGSLLGSVGSAMIEFGKLAIAAGVAALGIKIALTSLNPALAIAGGVALVALGAMVSSKGASIANNVSSGGGGYVQGDAYNGSPYQFAPTSSYLDVSGLVRGQDIVIATNNTNRNNKRVRR